MSDWKTYIDELKKVWVGKKISYLGQTHKVIDVDMNGLLLIDKKARYTETTAISIADIKQENETTKDSKHWYLICSDDDPIETQFTNATMTRNQMNEKFVGKMVPNGGDEEYDVSHCVGIALESELEGQKGIR